jgi:hypothetical protein
MPHFTTLRQGKGQAAGATADIEDSFAIGRSNEVEKWPSKAPAPSAHLQFISIAVSCEERRGSTGGQVHQVILRRPPTSGTSRFQSPGISCASTDSFPERRTGATDCKVSVDCAATFSPRPVDVLRVVGTMSLWLLPEQDARHSRSAAIEDRRLRSLSGSCHCAVASADRPNTWPDRQTCQTPHLY